MGMPDMAKVKVDFTVTPKLVAAYMLDVGLLNVPLVSGKGSIRLEEETIHTAIWRMRGNPGGTIGISYTVRGLEVVLVKESKIRPKSLTAFGFKDFKV